MRKMIVLSVVCDKDVKDLSQLIAQRAWTIDGVTSVEVAHEFPSDNEPRPTPAPVPENVWAELPHFPELPIFMRLEKVFKKFYIALGNK